MIVGGYMVPHPPIIMSEVGHGDEKQIQITIDAYETASRELVKSNPDTVVIVSPHATSYADYFHISPGKSAQGNMFKFRAGDIHFSVRYDTGLIEEICRKADRLDFPAGTLGEQDKNLDHGTMIPLYFIRKFIQLDKLRFVRIGLSGLSLEEHYKLGEIIKEASNAKDRRVAFVASGDLSHKLKEDGPYGFVKEGPEYDEKIMDVMGSADFMRLFDFKESFLDAAAECGHRSFVIMAGAFDRTALKAERLSHEDTFGVGYGICTFTPIGVDENRDFGDRRNRMLTQDVEKKRETEDIYVRMARASLETYINERTGLDAKETFEKLAADDELGFFEIKELKRELLKNMAGAFVSLHKNGKLRGCIGTFLPTQENVATEILKNAVSAGTNDPRFSPVRKDELAFLEYSVDILSDPEEVPDESYLDAKKYGVIVSSGRKRGLLLPDLDGVDTVEQQIEIASAKGGIEPGEPVILQRFTVERHT